MDLNTPGYVKLGGTAAKDSFSKQVKQSFNEDSYDFPSGKLIGGPVDVKGGSEEGFSCGAKSGGMRDKSC